MTCFGQGSAEPAMNDKQLEIVAELRRIAELLNKDYVSQRDFGKLSEIGVTTVEYNFGSWNRAIQAAGLVPPTLDSLPGKRILTDDALLQEILRLALELGKPPTEREMTALGRFSVKPYRKR